MANFLDELVIGIRVKAEGVKSGINEAKKHLISYKKQIKALQEEIKLKFDKSGIKDIENAIFDLNKRKQELETEIKIKTNTSAINNLKSQMKDIDLQIKDVKINVEDNQAKQKLKELENIKLSLQKEINSKVKVEIENKDKLNKELNIIAKEIQKLERQKQITLETSGINKAKTELKNLNEKLKEVENINKGMNSSFLTLGATATAVFAGIIVSVNKGIDAYNQYTNAMSGLKSQMEYVGEDIGKATEMVKELTKDGLMSETDVAMAIKNLTSYGYSLQQANDMILRLKDSAAYNRQSHYELGEAVRVTTEGIRNENSVLSDAAGVTKNIAKMYEEYAQTLGKSSQNLTQAEKAQAVYKGVMQETKAVLGDAKEYSEQLGGEIAKNDAQIKKLAQAYGSALAPTVKEFTILMTNAISEITEFTNENQGLIAGATTGITTFISLGSAIFALSKGTVVIKSLVTGLKNLKTSLDLAKVSAIGFSNALGPISVVLSLVASIGVGVFTDIKTEIEKAKEEQKALNEEIEKFKKLMSEATTDLNIGLKETELENLEKAKEDLKEIYEYYEKNPTSSNTTGISYEKKDFDYTFINKLGKTEEELQNLKEAIGKCGLEFDDLFNNFNELKPEFTIFDETIKQINNDLEHFNKTEKFNIDLNGLSNSLSNVEGLTGVYEKLARGEELASSELSKLIAQNFELANYVTQTGDLSLDNGTKILEQIDEQILSQKQLMVNEQSRIDNSISKTKEQIKANEELLNTLTGDAYNKKEQEIRNLNTQLKEYEQQAVKAKASISLLNNELNNLDINKMIGEYKKLASNVDLLNSSYQKLSNGESLTYEETKKLIDTFPELQQYLQKTGDVSFKSGNLILDITNQVITAYNTKRESLIANSNAEIKAIEKELEAITSMYEQERLSLIDLMKAREIAYNNNITFDIAGPRMPQDYVDEVSQGLRQRLENSKKLIQELEAMGDISKKGQSSSGSGISKSVSNTVKEQNTELQKQLDIYNKLKETTELSSTEQLKQLENIKYKYAKTAEDFEKIDKLIYSTRKQVNDEWYNNEIKTIQKLNKGREDNTDFAGIINKYQELIQELKVVYKDYPQTLKQLEEEVNNYIIEVTEQRLLKISNLEKDALNQKIKNTQEHIGLMKKLNGLETTSGKIIFTYQDEAKLIKQNLDDITKAINEFVSKKVNNTKDMINADKEYYEYLLDMQKSYNNKYMEIIIDGEKEKQEKEKQANEKRIQDLKDSFKKQEDLAKDYNKKYIEDIKSRYEQEIELAKNASNEEISIYEERIKAIDDILKQDSRNERDEGILDKIKRAEEQLKYETNESNKYELQKEINLLKDEYQKNKKKDSLEDEKETLQEQINYLKETNNQKIEELQKMRDYELEQAEKMLESYIISLEKRLETEIKINDKGTKNLNENLDKRLNNIKKMYAKKEKATIENVNNENKIIEDGTNKLINTLYNFTSIFSDIGNRWGQAVADAFNSVVDSINSNIPYTATYNFEQNERNRSSGDSQISNYNFNQTINANNFSPSRARREMEQMLSRARYL